MAVHKLCVDLERRSSDTTHDDTCHSQMRQVVLQVVVQVVLQWCPHWKQEKLFRAAENCKYLLLLPRAREKLGGEPKMMC